jgi:hypothetical protein
LPQITAIGIEQWRRSTLIFALVGAAGTRLGDLSKTLREELESFGYHIIEIRLSDLLPNMTSWSQATDMGRAERARHSQNIGDTFRRKLWNGTARVLRRSDVNAQRFLGVPINPQMLERISSTNLSTLTKQIF